jgi:hypothetical protein
MHHCIQQKNSKIILACQGKEKPSHKHTCLRSALGSCDREKNLTASGPVSLPSASATGRSTSRSHIECISYRSALGYRLPKKIDGERERETVVRIIHAKNLIVKLWSKRDHNPAKTS